MGIGGYRCFGDYVLWKWEYVVCVGWEVCVNSVVAVVAICVNVSSLGGV
jgi:hypothetical protein